MYLFNKFLNMQFVLSESLHAKHRPNMKHLMINRRETDLQ